MKKNGKRLTDSEQALADFEASRKAYLDNPSKETFNQFFNYLGDMIYFGSQVIAIMIMCELPEYKDPVLQLNKITVGDKDYFGFYTNQEELAKSSIDADFVMLPAETFVDLLLADEDIAGFRILYLLRNVRREMPEETRIVIKGGRTEDTVISSFPGAAQAAPWGGLVPLRFFLYAPVEKSKSGPTGHLFGLVRFVIRRRFAFPFAVAPAELLQGKTFFVLLVVGEDQGFGKADGSRVPVTGGAGDGCMQMVESFVAVFLYFMIEWLRKTFTI